MNDQVAVQFRLPDAFFGMRHQRAEGHGEVMVVDEFLALEIQLGHSSPFDASASFDAKRFAPAGKAPKPDMLTCQFTFPRPVNGHRDGV